MAMRDGTDQNAGDWWTQNAPPAAPSWLPPGAVQNPDGSITLSNGSVMPAPPPGYTRDPQTGVISFTGGAPMQPGLTTPTTPNPVFVAQAPRATETPNLTTTGGTTTTGSTTTAPITTEPIGVPTSGFGAAPPPYASDPNAPTFQPLAPYVAPQWTGGDYIAPTEAELYASPGYQARLDARLQAGARRYAAQGTILNGGTVKALDRSAQDYATDEYQTLNRNKYDEYKTRYAQFADAAGRDLASRSINAADANTTYANRTAAYTAGNTRTLSDYITNVNNKRNSELDYWSRLQDVNNTGANLAGGSR